MANPVISVSQMREWEKATWAAGQSEESVIRQVGLRLAERLEKWSGPGDRIVILAGKGHNGDDARQIVPHLQDREVRLIEAKEPAQVERELAEILHRPVRWLIDGLFGIGLNRPLDGQWRNLIESINRSGCPVLSVDVPSGLNAATGRAEGDAIRAAATLTLGAVKEGLIQCEAWEYVGRLEVIPDIGLIPCPVSTEIWWTDGNDFGGFPPPRAVASHKGSFGHTVLIAGSQGYHGAAVLSARAALKAQPGLVTVYTQHEAYLPVASQLQAAMVRPWRPGLELPRTATSMAIGPGLASDQLKPEWRAMVQGYWRESKLPVIVDASALAWLPEGPTPPSAIRVMTPHPGEAARLLGNGSREVQQDRFGAVRALSDRYGGCWVVLKGHETVIGRREGSLYVNGTGNPFLAQGGSGDVLTGLLGGLLAQPLLQKEAERTLRFGVWAHGMAADRLQASVPQWGIESLVEALSWACGSMRGTGQE